MQHYVRMQDGKVVLNGRSEASGRRSQPVSQPDVDLKMAEDPMAAWKARQQLQRDHDETESKKKTGSSSQKARARRPKPPSLQALRASGKQLLARSGKELRVRDVKEAPRAQAQPIVVPIALSHGEGWEPTMPPSSIYVDPPEDDAPLSPSPARSVKTSSRSVSLRSKRAYAALKARLAVAAASCRKQPLVVGPQAAKVDLLGAVMRGDESQVEAALQKGADASRATDDGGSPLMWAVALGHVGVVRRLLAAGANTFAANRLGLSAVDIAQRKRRFTCAKLIEDARELDRTTTNRWSSRQKSTAV